MGGRSLGWVAAWQVCPISHVCTHRSVFFLSCRRRLKRKERKKAFLDLWCEQDRVRRKGGLSGEGGERIAKTEKREQKKGERREREREHWCRGGINQSKPMGAYRRSKVRACFFLSSFIHSFIHSLDDFSMLRTERKKDLRRRGRTGGGCVAVRVAVSMCFSKPAWAINCMYDRMKKWRKGIISLARIERIVEETTRCRPFSWRRPGSSQLVSGSFLLFVVRRFSKALWLQLSEHSAHMMFHLFPSCIHSFQCHRSERGKKRSDCKPCRGKNWNGDSSMNLHRSSRSDGVSYWCLDSLYVLYPYFQFRFRAGHCRFFFSSFASFIVCISMWSMVFFPVANSRTSLLSLPPPACMNASSSNAWACVAFALFSIYSVARKTSPRTSPTGNRMKSCLPSCLRDSMHPVVHTNWVHTETPTQSPWETPGLAVDTNGLGYAWFSIC